MSFSQQPCNLRLQQRPLEHAEAGSEHPANEKRLLHAGHALRNTPHEQHRRPPTLTTSVFSSRQRKAPKYVPAGLSPGRRKYRKHKTPVGPTHLTQAIFRSYLRSSPARSATGTRTYPSGGGGGLPSKASSASSSSVGAVSYTHLTLPTKA